MFSTQRIWGKHPAYMALQSPRSISTESDYYSDHENKNHEEDENLNEENDQMEQQNSNQVIIQLEDYFP